MASKSTVYLLCIALLLLPAHVCLGFLDRSPGLTDHTCGERELSTKTSSTMTKKRGKTRNCSQQQTVKQVVEVNVFDTQMHLKVCMN